MKKAAKNCHGLRCIRPNMKEVSRIATRGDFLERRPLSIVPLIMNSSQRGARIAVEITVSPNLSPIFSKSCLK